MEPLDNARAETATIRIGARRPKGGRGGMTVHFPSITGCGAMANPPSGPNSLRAPDVAKFRPDSLRAPRSGHLIGRERGGGAGNEGGAAGGENGDVVQGSHETVFGAHPALNRRTGVEQVVRPIGYAAHRGVAHPEEHLV